MVGSSSFLSKGLALASLLFSKSSGASRPLARGYGPLAGVRVSARDLGTCLRWGVCLLWADPMISYKCCQQIHKHTHMHTACTHTQNLCVLFPCTWVHTAGPEILFSFLTDFVNK